MDEPKSLDSLFKEKIFRIPDYQRGYAWQREQLKAFWEDLVNLSDSRSHYTGVLTLKQIEASEVKESSNEYWLVDGESYQVYHIVDGQQRLTTFIVFLQALVDFVKSLPENQGKLDEAIYLTENLSLASLQIRFLFKTKPTGDQFRTYKFGYTEDNPSYDYLRYRILGEPGGGSVQETFYTLNLSNAQTYFDGQLREMHAQAGMAGIQDIYKKLTKRFLFNEYVIKDEFDVFVAFETMNNRGKKLSDLELLKNRLIYLTTLYTDEELDKASRKSLRDTINDAWKEVYRQLGRNKSKPLNDDEFLRAHWVLYYKYSRKTGYDYIRFLLDEQFTPQRIHKKIEKDVELELTEEQRSGPDFEDDELDIEEDDAVSETTPILTADLSPTEIRDYVRSLKECAAHWFNSYYPLMAENMGNEERRWIEALNRIGMTFFRPLLMAVLKSVGNETERIGVFQKIERFIFLMFRTTTVRANYRSSEFYIAARAVDRGELTASEIGSKLESGLADLFDEDGFLRITDFHNLLFKKFQSGSGYYSWSGLRYFLYEYELSLLEGARQKKVDWSDLLKTERDRISIEHIYPQTETDAWAEPFAAIPAEKRPYYKGTLGNLLLLSASINSSLQNDSFAAKKHPQYGADGKKLRNGYSDGSHSEIEVSANESWGPTQIRDRGLLLLKFMEMRWEIKIKDDDREELLFLSFGEEIQPEEQRNPMLPNGV
jgi:uncharacterized protein with ParB-like and HNH nuclease domain